jgi:two-component system chemotaxis response regulator CheB
MPPFFTKLLAERLSRLSAIPVVEAVHGMEVVPGTILIAPGDFHMRLVRKLGRVEVELNQQEPEHSCRPAVDVLFRSIAETYGASAVAVILTGMGQDGLIGVRTLKGLGARVLVQDNATSVVWGMPGAVAAAQLADAILPLRDIIPEALRLL